MKHRRDKGSVTGRVWGHTPPDICLNCMIEKSVHCEGIQLGNLTILS